MLASLGGILEAGIQPNEVVLSGSSSTPNWFLDNAITPTDAKATWEFRTDGTIWQVKANAADAQFQDGIEWSGDQDSPTEDRWIRFTLDGTGDAPTGGSALNTWLRVGGTGAAMRSVEWEETTNGFATTGGRVKVEISSDSGGLVILATGYYEAFANVEL